MNNLKKKFLISIFLLLSSCGYEPLFSTDKNNFSIINIKISGDKNISSMIERRLKIYKNAPKKEKNFYVEINSSKNRVIASKDTKGDPKTFRIELISELNVLNNNQKISSRIFKESQNYNNRSSKFDLKEFEEKTLDNLIEKISEDIIIFLQSL